MMLLEEEADAEQGKQLTRLRRERGFSQTALAQALDVTRQAVSAWERGKALPSTENLMKLSQLLQVELSVLTGRGGPGETDEPEKPEDMSEPEEPNEPEEPDGPGEKPGKPARRRKLLWPVCLGAACAVVCVVFLILWAHPWAKDTPDEPEVVPIEEVNRSEIEILPEDYIEFDPW